MSNDETSRTAVFDFMNLQALLSASEAVWENYFRYFCLMPAQPPTLW